MGGLPDDLPTGETKFLQDMKAAAERLAKAQETLGAITGEGTAANDMIKVVTDRDGGLTSLKLSPRIRRLDSEALAEELTKAIQAAQADARRKSEDATAEVFGEDLWAKAHDPERFGKQAQEIQETLARSLEGHLSVIEGKLSGKRWK
jgi:DNA-binding protein YbaB